jgi:hypothetical protein
MIPEIIAVVIGIAIVIFIVLWIKNKQNEGGY